MDILSSLGIIDALMDLQNALSLEELCEQYASILPRENKCNRIFP